MYTFRKGICVFLVCLMTLGAVPLGEAAPFLNEAPFTPIAYATAGDAGGDNAAPVDNAPVQAQQEQVVEIRPFAEGDTLLSGVSIEADDETDNPLVEGGQLFLNAELDFGGVEDPVRGDIKIQWQYYDTSSSTWEDIEGANEEEDQLIPPALVKNEMLIGCRVIQNENEGDSSITISPEDEDYIPYTIKAAEKSIITIEPSDGLKILVGSEAKFSIEYADNVEIKTVEWKVTSDVGSFPDTTITNEESLAFTPTEAVSMTLSCTVTATLDDIEGVAWSQTVNDITLDVIAKPTVQINPNPETPWSTSAQGPRTLEASVEDDDLIEPLPDDAVYKWYKDGVLIPDANGGELPITLDTLVAGAYKYRCEIYLNEADADNPDVEPFLKSNEFELIIVDHPTISPQPQNANAKAGDTVTFTSGFTGGTEEAYGVWQVNDGSGWKKYNDVTFEAGETATLSIRVTADMDKNKYQFVVFDQRLPGFTSLPSTPVTLGVSYLNLDPIHVRGAVGTYFEKEIKVTGNPPPVKGSYFVTGLIEGLGWRESENGIVILGTPKEEGDVVATVSVTTEGGGTESARLPIVVLAQPTPIPARFYIHMVAGSGGRGYANQYLAQAGDEITLSAVANSGYYFDHWEINGFHGADTKKTVTSFKMPSNELYVTPYFRSYGSGGSGSGMTYGLYGGVSGSWTISPMTLFGLTSGYPSSSIYSGTNYPSSSGMTTYNVPTPYAGVTFPSYAGTSPTGTPYTGTTTTGTSSSGAPSSITSSVTGASSSSSDPLAGVGVTQRSVTIYDAASSSGKKLGTLASGKGVMVLGYSGDFVRVRFDGQTGYIPMSDVKTAFNKPFIASTKARIPVYTEMRESTSVRYSMLESGARVSVIGMSGKWLIIAGAGGQVLYALASGFNT